MQTFEYDRKQSKRIETNLSSDHRESKAAGRLEKTQKKEKESPLIEHSSAPLVPLFRSVGRWRIPPPSDRESRRRESKSNGRWSTRLDRSRSFFPPDFALSHEIGEEATIFIDLLSVPTTDVQIFRRPPAYPSPYEFKVNLGHGAASSREGWVGAPGRPVIVKPMGAHP